MRPGLLRAGGAAVCAGAARQHQQLGTLDAAARTAAEAVGAAAWGEGGGLGGFRRNGA